MHLRVTPPACPVRPETERVLIALSAEERQMLYPGHGPDGDLLPGVASRWFDPKRERDRWPETLRKFSPTILLSCWATPPLPADYVESPAFSLRYVCHTAGSVRALVPPGLIERGILVTNWGALASRPVAEQALLLILASLRRVPRWRRYLLEDRRLETRTLEGQRVGLHGFGRIARSLVELLRPFRVGIAAYSAGVPPALMTAAGVRPCASLEELFSSSTVLVECEALTPESAGSVTRGLLERLPPEAIFVNVARGRLVDERALAELAASGRLQVALDVYAREPLAHDSPLLEVPDALLSPHIGGPTYDLLPACGEQALDNLRAYLENRPVSSVITPEIYERST